MGEQFSLTFSVIEAYVDRYFSGTVLFCLTPPATVYLLIFLWEWDKKHLISSPLNCNCNCLKWTCSFHDKDLPISAPKCASLLCHPSVLLFLICRLLTHWLSLWFADRRLIFPCSPLEMSQRSWDTQSTFMQFRQNIPTRWRNVHAGVKFIHTHLNILLVNFSCLPIPWWQLFITSWLPWESLEILVNL